MGIHSLENINFQEDFMKRFKFLALMLIAAAMAFTACGNDGGGEDDGLINGYNVNLSSFELSDGTLSPLFSKSTIAYNAEVDNSVSSITVTPTVADVDSTITVNGEAVISGTASGPIALSEGQNTITTVVTAEDSTTTKTYTVVVTRLTFAESSNNADLSGLSLSSGSLSPSFGVNTTSYNAEVNYDVSSITVTATVAGSGATVAVNGTTVTSGTASGLINLNVDENTTITTVVTADDGTTTKTYTVVVTRLEGLYTVTYNVGTVNTTGTVPVDETNYSSGNTVTVLSDTGSLKGELIHGTTYKAFLGWDTDASATVAQYKADGTFTITENTILYAIYTALRVTGPAGGLIFYDKGNDDDGWRYLEAAPHGWYKGGDDPHAQWGGYAVSISGTGTDIGDGSGNTSTIVSFFDSLHLVSDGSITYYDYNWEDLKSGTVIFTDDSTDYELNYRNDGNVAAKICDDYDDGIYSDWFLPSKDELWQMCWNLRGLRDEDGDSVQNPDVPVGGVGGFADNIYWSSSEYFASYACYQDFDGGYQDDYPKEYASRVRAVRAF